MMAPTLGGGSLVAITIQHESHRRKMTTQVAGKRQRTDREPSRSVRCLSCGPRRSHPNGTRSGLGGYGSGHVHPGRAGGEQVVVVARERLIEEGLGLLLVS